MTSKPRLTSFDSLAVLLPESYASRQPKTVTTQSSTPARITPSTIARRRMPRPASTPLTGTVIIGTVQMFYVERGFGFAQATVDGTAQKIYFNVSRGHEVIGTADEPQLTSTFKDHSVEKATEIAIIVGESDQGLYAAAWGLLPKRTWYANAIKFDDSLRQFIGGFVSVSTNDELNATTSYYGTLADINLANDELTIVIANCTKHTPDNITGDKCSMVALCYKLKESYLDTRAEHPTEGSSRKTIIVSDPAHGQQRIAIYMPEQATKNSD